MAHIGCKQCLADPDLWMLTLVSLSDGPEYYASVSIHHASEEILLYNDAYFKTKPGFIGDPAIYLGATIKKMHL